jgi:hypothetical protein
MPCEWHRRYKLEIIAYLGFSRRGGRSFDTTTPCIVKTASSSALSAVDWTNKRQDFGFSISLTSKWLLKSCISCLSHAVQLICANSANQNLLCTPSPAGSLWLDLYSQTHFVPECFLHFRVSLLRFQETNRLTCLLYVIALRQHFERHRSVWQRTVGKKILGLSLRGLVVF